MAPVALLLVDIQNDFMEKGSLAVPNASQIMPAVLRLINDTKDRIVVASKDWHPSNHISFASNHADKQPFEQIKFEYRGRESQQILWPTHCVQGSTGAELAKDILSGRIDYIVNKGQNHHVDSYSAFADNDYHEITSLAKILYQNFVDTVIVVGLAADYCVKMTCLDAVKFGFKTILVKEGTRAVSPNDFESTMQELQDNGVEVVSIDDAAFVSQYLQ
ncbi:hypothetical protein O0I10_011897 [Lichtheimia ornata]|uniref:nicotinamidase n=1 Tax=Lichtheimia ornata TaxID=688661 RepID=A0AAD7XS47_9FUNG|nr:uncharacterized protein O0I10_011897 [Lichtheimia ornata]KAJ8652430.1 hypothetical protein O0I10_011897 [Lichtheimia ornata]